MIKIDLWPRRCWITGSGTFAEISQAAWGVPQVVQPRALGQPALLRGADGLEPTAVAEVRAAHRPALRPVKTRSVGAFPAI